MKVWAVAAWAALLCAGASAQAEDGDRCRAGMICASAPQTVFDGMQQAGVSPEMSIDDSGDPMIKGAYNGWSFVVFFYGCEAHEKCDSMQFLATFDDDGANTAELTNSWNSRKRFSQLSVDEDSQLNFRYDVTTRGGLTQENFADVIDWWKVMLEDLSDFFDENVS